MSLCPFLSTSDEKINCYKECPFYHYEEDSEGCPFRKSKAKSTINMKEIAGFDLTYDNEEDKQFIERIYVKNYF
ncbi:hypothetical protein IAI10_00730 [Clostridium sp. 19966]|uniref:hypothetical protein n=1 Tax=Clostridium sp. 19966 TaxID=2768166 RepID=UPI0028DF05E8|nr:hypothetical protein [Clostridium sp. 19966]MDT8715206.1 hypothetical protein [Clostridium sp. 19966]